MGRLFGTDGIRGRAGEFLTADLARTVAAAAAAELGPATVVIGRDTRPSGPMLEAAAAQGFAEAGCAVLLLGVVPTPLVAHAGAMGTADRGLMISASHNPMPDNGLKVFGRGGYKIADAVEAAIEARLEEPPVRAASSVAVCPAPEHVVASYADDLVNSVEKPLHGLRVVVDCAQGSASLLAPEIYRRAGADVIALFADGDGMHINDECGATHLDALQAAVLEHDADLGIAHDGDADRCLAVDASGQPVDGDQILAICALGLQARGLLPTATVVATVMSNLGFLQAMNRAGIAVETTAVGDKHVLEAMRRGGHALGGEQSGHLVFLDSATTGDGLRTALAVMGRMVAAESPLSTLAAAVQLLPQVLVNVAAERSRATADDVL
ncbi:MAG TPA: phosphoglucosamine mutase, partial [Mycobacteriales bacterium]|nr:phosphoglucosamine mutase [Mycobacteriales bacterium]